MNVAVFVSIGVALIIIGIIIIITTIIIGLIRNVKKIGVSGSGVIIVGPIPIIFGKDKASVKAILALALILAVVVLIIMVLNYWFLR